MRILSRGWLITLIGVALLAGGLFALCFPVFLGSYDSAGMQVKCGNGYYADLVQATTDDQQSASGVVQAATNYVDQCQSALAHRREWLIPVVAIGAVIAVSGLATWSLTRSPRPAATTNRWSEIPTDALHDAEVLDRRSHRGWPRSSDTTL
jgi:hypothetical protein